MILSHAETARRLRESRRLMELTTDRMRRIDSPAPGPVNGPHEALSRRTGLADTLNILTAEQQRNDNQQRDDRRNRLLQDMIQESTTRHREPRRRSPDMISRRRSPDGRGARLGSPVRDIFSSLRDITRPGSSSTARQGSSSTARQGSNSNSPENSRRSYYAATKDNSHRRSRSPAP